MKKAFKWLLIGVGIFIVIGIIAVATDKEDQPGKEKPVVIKYLSARDVKIKLAKEGYDFSAPYYLEDDLIRINSFSAYRQRTALIFYRNDTIINASVVIKITENRDNLEESFSNIKSFVEAIDETAGEWASSTVSGHDTKKDLEKDTVINKRKVVVNYYPDVNNDLLKIEYSNPDK